MPARIIVEVAKGRKVILGGAADDVGLAEVGIADDIAKATREQFKGAMSSLAGLVTMLEQSVGRLAKRPDKVEIQFRAALTADCDLWVVSGSGEAEFTVTLGWGASD